MLNRFKSGGLAIHCETYEEWKLLIDITYHNIEDMRNIPQEKWDTSYSDYYGETCLCSIYNIIGFASYGYLVSNYKNITIITFEEFISESTEIPMPSKSDLIDFLTGE